MPLYNKASQQVVPGLVRRRAAETAIFTGGNATGPGNETVTPSNSPISGGDGEITSSDNTATSSPSTNFSNAESLSEIVTQMENNDEWWINALDEYLNFTYNI